MLRILTNGEFMTTPVIPVPNHIETRDDAGFDINRLTRIVANPSVRALTT